MLRENTDSRGPNIRPHRIYHLDAAFCYRRRTFRGLCVRECVLGTPVSPAETAEPIDMTFG